MPWSSSAFICFSPWSSIVFISFSNALPRGEYVNLACSIIQIWSEGSIGSPVRFSYLSILPDDSDIFAPSMLMPYCSSFYLQPHHQLSWLVFIFFLKDSFWIVKDCNITKKEYGFAVHFL